MVILTRSRDNALKISNLLKKQQASDGPSSAIASVQTIEDFLPTHQNEKITIFYTIQKILSPTILKKLSPKNKALIKVFFDPKILKPISEKDLPPMLLRKLSELDGTLGNMVLIEPTLSQKLQEGKTLIKFIKEIRIIADQIEPQAGLAGSLAVSSDMIEAINSDGPKATLFALLSVVLLVVILFRHLKTISLMLFSLFLGVTWLMGAIFYFQIKINFLNFIALPITFGIGTDYGVNIFQRYQETEKKDILRVIRNTGSAVALASFSTIVGYASLLIARNQGFVSFGVLAVIGELTCVFAAIVALPAFLVTSERRREKWLKK